MITENLSTLKIHKLTQEQYDRELAAGRIDENAIYLTPDEEMDLSPYATVEQLNTKANSSHTHDDRYYTETEIDNKLSGKANTSHGNHVPTTQAANNATFLRNDNTWQKVTPANIGAAASSHNHDAANITSGRLALARGGVGQDLTSAPNFAIIRRTGDGTDALWYTPTANGAFYATAANGAAKFGTLPIAQGGTGATTAAAARTNLGVLPLSGGTITGDVTFNNANCIINGSGVLGISVGGSGGTSKVIPIAYMSDATNVHLGRNTDSTTAHPGDTYVNALKGSVYLKNSNGSQLRWFKYAGDSYNNIFRCETDVDAILGSSSCRWYRVYNSTSSCTTSDEREKSDITPISDYPVMYAAEEDGNVFEQFFDKLVPTTYSLNFEKDTKLHIGFIAQEVENAANEIGLPVEELGFVIHDYWKDEETGEDRDRYSLGYEEFIALNTYIIQKQKSKIESLEERIAKLEASNSSC